MKIERIFSKNFARNYEKNNAWNIRCLVNETSVPLTQCIILKIFGFLEKNDNNKRLIREKFSNKAWRRVCFSLACLARGDWRSFGLPTLNSLLFFYTDPNKCSILNYSDHLKVYYCNFNWVQNLDEVMHCFLWWYISTFNSAGCCSI